MLNQNTRYSFLIEDDTTKNLNLFHNYLALGDFELAKAILLTSFDDKKQIQILQQIINGGIPNEW